jgi:DNA-binding NarL/FixJ family response regulator
MIRVLIADDHMVVRRGLKQVLSETPDIEVVAEAETGQQVLDFVRTKPVDALVLDIAMPDGNGLEVLRTLKKERPSLPVIVLSMHSEEQYGVLVLKAGAASYLTKETAPDQLIAAIKKVINGGKYVSVALAEKLAFDLEADPDMPLHERLSYREYQVLGMIAIGKTVGEIAEALDLSAKTISTYRSRILEKMKMRKNAELTHYAVRQGLVDAMNFREEAAPKRPVH